MIHRTFDKMKFKRSYVGGSKQRELEIFAEVQGTKEDNSEVNWLEYRRVFTQYSDDILNVILSWKRLMSKLSIGFLILTGVALLINPVLAIMTLLVSVACRLTVQYFKHRENKSMSMYNYSLNIILSAIKNEAGLHFTKN
jgi:hypothetical protein